MISVIGEHVAPGSIVVTDQWAAYRTAFETLHEFTHKSINHSLYFVNPNDPSVHTQSIEGLWSKSKLFIRKKSGLKQEQHSELLIQFVWQYKVEKRKRYSEFLSLIKFYY